MFDNFWGLALKGLMFSVVCYSCEYLTNYMNAEITSFNFQAILLRKNREELRGILLMRSDY